MDGRLPRDRGTTGGVDGVPGPDASTTAQVLLAHACRVLAARGLAEDVLGHVSLRTDRGLLVRGRGLAEEGLLLTLPADVREVGPDALPGHREDDGWAVPNELPIHTEVLRARPDVDAVVHCHPPDVVLASIEGVELRPVVGAFHIPAARLALAGVPVYPRAVLVRRPDLGREVAAALGAADVLVLRGHGIVTVGSGAHAVEQAVGRALALDVLARVCLASHRLGGRAPDLTPDEVAELPDLGGSFTDVMMFRHHLARLRHEGLLLEG